jgi:Family of unknown function (DUF5706)
MARRRVQARLGGGRRHGTSLALAEGLWGARLTTDAEETEPAGSGPSHERFMDFERGVLQDNIILCDAKSGVLLAFSGAMVIFCIGAFVDAHQASGRSITLMEVLLALAGLAFLVSCHFALTTVVPRLVRGRDDHIFWESSVFKLPVETYVAKMEALDPEVERRDMLRHLHMLSGICRSKFWHFGWAIRIAQLGFVLLVIAELTRLRA